MAVRVEDIPEQQISWYMELVDYLNFSFFIPVSDVLGGTSKILLIAHFAQRNVLWTKSIYLELSMKYGPDTIFNAVNSFHIAKNKGVVKVCVLGSMFYWQ